MKLKTILTASRDGSIVDATDENLIHDAAAAHALIMAMNELHKYPGLSNSCRNGAPQWILFRANSMLKQWGFDSGENA